MRFIFVLCDSSKERLVFYQRYIFNTGYQHGILHAFVLLYDSSKGDFFFKKKIEARIEITCIEITYTIHK